MAAKGAETVFGISCLHHDAALAVVRGEEILFASHAERYSRRKSDPCLNPRLIEEAVAVAGEPDRVVYYERPWRTRLRYLCAGQGRQLVCGAWPRTVLRRFPALRRAPFSCVGHHRSHAAAGFFTSPFRRAAVIVADAIGELETLSVWRALEGVLERVFSLRYPHSLGLFYTAFTDRVGLRPNEEECVTMALAAFGRPRYAELLRRELFADRPAPHLYLVRPLHRGVRDWRPEIDHREDLASSAQLLAEEYLDGLFRWAAATTGERHLVYCGGVALNCVANQRLAAAGHFDAIWIPPNPGDAGSALGAALAFLGRHVRWPGPYLGHHIDRLCDVETAARALAAGEIVGIANGRAEFGPRALGNRSLLADPRRAEMRERVNDIKRRQPFRPFAPIVLAEHASTWFELPFADSPYMQYAVPCRCPAELPAVCHVDGTSRVQTLTARQNPTMWALLRRFFELTDCPVLLNTSLNIRGEPIVNTWEDALAFSRRHGVLVV